MTGDSSKLTYEKMMEMSAELKNSSSSMQLIFTEIENLFKNVGNDETWGGNAAEEVKKAFVAIQSKFPDLFNAIKDCSNYLDSVVREFQAADSSVLGTDNFSNKA